MLSDAFLIHKKYLQLYESNTPILLYEQIHSHYNGDYFSRDVLMNIVIAEHLKIQAVPQASSCLWIKVDSWNPKRKPSIGFSSFTIFAISRSLYTFILSILCGSHLYLLEIAKFCHLKIYDHYWLRLQCVNIYSSPGSGYHKLSYRVEPIFFNGFIFHHEFQLIWISRIHFSRIVVQSMHVVIRLCDYSQIYLCP